jgi:hypothetical protein
LPRDHGLCGREIGGERRKFFSLETSVPLDLPANG